MTTQTFYSVNDRYYEVGMRIVSGLVQKAWGIIGVNGDTTTANYGLLRFDTSSLKYKKNIIITGAILRIYLESNLTANAGLDLKVHRSLRAWDDEANYYHYNTADDAWQVDGSAGDLDRESQHIGRYVFDYNATLGWYELNLRNYIPDGVQDMLRGDTFTDNGFYFTGQTSVNNTKKQFSSPEGGSYPPELVLTYKYATIGTPPIFWS